MVWLPGSSQFQRWCRPALLWVEVWREWVAGRFQPGCVSPEGQSSEQGLRQIWWTEDHQLYIFSWAWVLAGSQEHVH